MDKLLQEKSAYKCFCNSELSQADRKKKNIGDSPCKSDCQNLTNTELVKFEKNNRQFTIRLYASSMEIIYTDMIQGRVSFKGKTVGDFIMVPGYVVHQALVFVQNFTERAVLHIEPGFFISGGKREQKHHR